MNDLISLRKNLEDAMPKLAEVAPKHLKVERLVRILLSACSRNPKLLECTKESVLTFCMKCSETGLEPIGAGGAWPVPFKNNKTDQTEMQFIPDYRGLVNCAKRAGCITDAYAEVVKDADEFDYELGLEPKLRHKPKMADRGVPVNAYCIIEMPNGSKRFIVMDADEIEAIRRRSRAGDIGPWKSDVSEMWKKTVVRRAMKPFAGMSAELDAAIDADNKTDGINFERDSVRMPVIKGEKIPPKQEPGNSSLTSDQREMTPAPSFDRAAAITEIAALVDKAKAAKVHKAMQAVGIAFDEGEDWQQADDAKLKALLSFLKC